MFINILEYICNSGTIFFYRSKTAMPGTSSQSTSHLYRTPRPVSKTFERSLTLGENGRNMNDTTNPRMDSTNLRTIPTSAERYSYLRLPNE